MAVFSSNRLRIVRHLGEGVGWTLKGSLSKRIPVLEFG
jgi:hypothetical protein